MGAGVVGAARAVFAGADITIRANAPLDATSVIGKGIAVGRQPHVGMGAGVLRAIP